MACAVIRARAHDATAASVSYPTSNVALIFAKFCLDNKTSIFITLFSWQGPASPGLRAAMQNGRTKAAVRCDNKAMPAA
jgi:hypothetical protein